MNKIYSSLTLLALCCSTSLINAADAKDVFNVRSDIECKIRAFYEAQLGMRDQSFLSKNEKNVSNRKEASAIFSRAGIAFDFIEKANPNFIYGAKIVIIPTAKRKGGGAFDGSHLFFEGKIGKIQLGSPHDAADTMKIDYTSVDVESSHWARYANLSPDTAQHLGMAPAFASSYDFFLDGKLSTTADKLSFTGEPARRVAYYTPKINLNDNTNIQLGMSYTPDSTNTGAGSHSSNSNQANVVKGDLVKYEIDESVTQGFSAGIVLHHKLNEDTDLKVAFTGERGSPSGKAKIWSRENKDDEFPAEPNLGTHSLEPLNAYNIGLEFSYSKYSCAFSYGSLGNSLTTKEIQKNNQETKYLSGAIAYSNGPLDSSISYFRSEKYGNKLNVVSLGTSYKLARNLRVYGAISCYDGEGKPEFYADDENVEDKKISGTVAVIGTKISL